jgi:hypothetical protein
VDCDCKDPNYDVRDVNVVVDARDVRLWVVLPLGAGDVLELWRFHL